MEYGIFSRYHHQISTANMESLADIIKDNNNHKNLEHFREFLRSYTDIFTNNIYAKKDYPYYNLRGMIHNKGVIVFKGDKDSSVVIMKKSDCLMKLDTMIDNGIMKGTYVETTKQHVRKSIVIPGLFYRNFHNYERYKDVQPDSNQLARLYETAKTHKLETLEGITVANLKFRPIIDQTGMFTYNATKVISDYLRPLCKNEYSINGTQKIPKHIFFNFTFTR